MLKLFRTALNLGLLLTATLNALLGDWCSCDALIAHIRVHGKILQSPPLCLRDEQSGEDTSEHESREDLHDVVEPGVGLLRGSTTSAERSNGTLGDDGTNLAGASRDTVGSRRYNTERLVCSAPYV